MLGITEHEGVRALDPAHHRFEGGHEVDRFIGSSEVVLEEQFSHYSGIVHPETRKHAGPLGQLLGVGQVAVVGHSESARDRW